MFTGLIEDVGEVVSVNAGAGSTRLNVRTALPVSQMRLGDSVAVDGACYTVVKMGAHDFSVDIGPESLDRTTSGELRTGHKVNLERAVSVGQRLGGHFVLGHVDAVGIIEEIRARGDAIDYRISAPSDVIDLTVPKGSVTVDGISLTVNDVVGNAFLVSIIPHTQEKTSLGGKQKGRRVNLESDVLARSVAWLMERRGVLPPTKAGQGVTEEVLKRAGFM